MAVLDAATLLKGVVFVVVLAMFVEERRRPAVDQAFDAARLGRNLSFLVANIALSMAVVIPVTALAEAHNLGWRPGWWSGAPGLIADLLLIDCWIYVWHRLNHRIPFLWRFH
ncbi:MAG: hypothetical protein CMM46_17170 [Rhodospirillaceae bacterium]|nr:hypothetical protein [Rhodospirillaceae bacterium]|tara:strand:+ start:40 stop:375 length:336 start_codon:yes stop_codon:yes gene_type:complete